MKIHSSFGGLCHFTHRHNSGKHVLKIKYTPHSALSESLFKMRNLKLEKKKFRSRILFDLRSWFSLSLPAIARKRIVGYRFDFVPYPIPSIASCVTGRKQDGHDKEWVW